MASLTNLDQCLELFLDFIEVVWWFQNSEYLCQITLKLAFLLFIAQVFFPLAYSKIQPKTTHTHTIEKYCSHQSQRKNRQPWCN